MRCGNKQICALSPVPIKHPSPLLQGQVCCVCSAACSSLLRFESYPWLMGYICNDCNRMKNLPRIRVISRLIAKVKMKVAPSVHVQLLLYLDLGALHSDRKESRGNTRVTNGKPGAFVTLVTFGKATYLGTGRTIMLHFKRQKNVLCFSKCAHLLEITM
jgi:hypothetical protein